MPTWTKEQTQAINQEGNNILVSAGAGSGKTAVLSERVLRKVMDGVNVDEILILTFTKAAAYEMMLRIRSKLEKNNLVEQVNRIDKAYITTFDSFSMSIVKKYHDKLNLDKNITIIDENVISLLKKEYLDEIFDEYYHSNDEKFLKLITDFCLRDDKELKSYIININDKLDLKYNKKEYLENYINDYFDTDNVNKKYNQYIELLKDIISKIKDILANLELVFDGDYFYDMYQLFVPLFEASTYDEIKQNTNIDLPRLPKNSSEETKTLKKQLSNYLDELKELCIYENSNEMLSNYYSTKDYIITMVEIIKKLDQKVYNYKFKHNAFEFIDVSKLAIKLVDTYPEICLELKKYFNEIMIDEYQDTSDLQEEFINHISNNNVYMVGDIKQSIYRFRNANPFIFQYKYDNYGLNKGGIKIDLNKNFRSRKEVLENINYIFDSIMDNSYGGANYQESHQMQFGNNTYIEEGNTTQDYNIDLYNYSIDKDSPYSNYTKDEIEAFIIASDIKKKIDNKYQIFDKDKLILRDIRYSDFVILMDRSSKFYLYKKIFEYLKIPLTILKDENIMDQNEVYLIRNILKLIDCVNNQKYDNTFKYSFISIARSYLFSYSDQEIFHIIKTNSYFETELIKKCLEIVDLLPNLDLRTLLSKIVEVFDFHTNLIRVGNVQMGISVLEYFIELATNIQNLGYDYKYFITYLDNIIDTNKEIKIPVSINDDNSCRIMTIHKSKGLEYSICYYSGLASTFNVSDLKEKVLFDNEYGIITPSFNEGYQDTFYKTLFKKKYYREEIGEKIRLFYVALTRCKEKMIVVTSIKEEENILDDGLVSSNIREQYRSFLDILKSIYYKLSSRIINIELENIEITHDYQIFNTVKIDKENSDFILDVSEYQSNDMEVEASHFSKSLNHLITKEEKDNMLYGTRIHELFEIIDFKNPELDNLDITVQESKWITNFLNQDVLKNIEKANIIKEYEFYMLDDKKEEKHGIIDLMLEYENHIDIIDYKLKHIDDISYIEQLNGYKNYIENKFKRRVNIYLYSIITNSIKEIY